MFQGSGVPGRVYACMEDRWMGCGRSLLRFNTCVLFSIDYWSEDRGLEVL